MAAAAPKALSELVSVIRPLHPSTEGVVPENGKTFAAVARQVEGYAGQVLDPVSNGIKTRGVVASHVRLNHAICHQNVF